MVKIITRSWPLQIALLAILYFVAGKLALLLAVPPGYASSIWPPAGLSVAALLVFGRNRWLGVFIGAFLTSYTAGVLPNSIFLALLIASGNTAAALVACSIVRRVIQYPKSFYLEKDILLFLVFVGPVSALFSASIGTSALLLFEKIHPVLFWMNWLHWFIGDSSGGIIFAPLALIFSINSRKYWLGSISKVVLPLALCLTLLICALQYLNKVDGARISEDFHRQSEFSFSLLEKDLNSFQALLGTLQSFYESSSDVSLEEFSNFSYHLLSRIPEIHALLWIPVLSERNYSFKVSYVEPLEKNKHFMDRDLSQHNEYKDLILKALRSSNIITSSPIFLEGASGISLALAVSHPRGVLIEVIDPSSVTNSLVSFINDESYQLKIIDMSLPHRPVEIMQAWGARQEPPSFNPQLHWHKDLKLGDRTWRLEVRQDPSLRPSAAFNTATFLFTSLIFSFLTCALLLTTANRIITTQAVVDQKTLHLQELNLQLERASKTKSEFLANMSHEIRTPLNVIVGMADLLEDAPLVDQQRRYLEIARKAGDNLLAIINDILDISKIESGLITIEKTAVDLPEVVSEVYEMYLPRAQSKRIDFKMILDDNVKNVYLGDATRIRQILNNLLANAFKFTEKGSITLRVSPHRESMIPGNIIFSIEDTGIGIAPEVIPSLFKPFTQADTTITRKFGGTGLGLSICKRLTEMMNGFISVDSQLGRGSTFRFTLTLPFVRPADSRSSNVAGKNTYTSSGQALRILVVDDADDNRMLIRAYLQGTPHHLMEADNGLQALELVKGHDFDVILMDMQMPGMDGFTAVRKIREFEVEAHRRPASIWALTAYALKAEIQRSLDAGCERHLTKPLRKQELLGEIATYNQSRH